MPARLRNFIFEKGGDFYRRLNVTDSNGVSVDLSSGYTATAAVYAAQDETGSPLLSLSVSLGNGYIDLSATKAVIAAVDLSAVTRSGTIDEPAPNDDPSYTAFGKLAYYRLVLAGPDSLDDDCLLRGQICFANR